MEYLHEAEVKALLKVSYEYGNHEAHLALLTMYATGTRVSQALQLKGIDIVPDPATSGYKIRIVRAKRGTTRSFRVFVSPNPDLDMSALIATAFNGNFLGEQRLPRPGWHRGREWPPGPH